jgi:hypothetical protein
MSRGADRPQTDHHLDATPGRQAARLVVDPSDADQPLLSNARSASGNIYPYFYPYFVCAERHSKRTHCTRPAILVDKAEQLVADHYRTIQIPADLLKEEQDRLARQLDLVTARLDALGTIYEEARTHLQECLALAGDCQTVYTCGSDRPTRRMANQAPTWADPQRQAGKRPTQTLMHNCRGFE